MLAVVLAAVVSAGCGEDRAASDRAAVTRAVRGYLEAEAAGGDRVCDFLNSEGRRARAQLYAPLPVSRSGCGRLPGFAPGERGDETRSEVEMVRRAAVRVDSLDEGRARASITIGGERVAVALRKAGDRWLISEFDEGEEARRAREDFLRITRRVDKTTNTARGLACRGFRFDSDRWKSTGDDQGEPPTPRQRLADAAIKCSSLEGLAEDRVLALLGRPDDYLAERGERSWRTGIERNVFAVDSEHLVVRLRAGSVTRVELKTD